MQKGTQATQEPLAPTAAEVKASLSLLIDKLYQAWKYSYDYDGSPDYVVHTTFHISHKILDLQQEARNLRDRCPDKFRGQVR